MLIPNDPDLIAFDRQCCAHDWTFYQSDSFDAYQRGVRSRQALLDQLAALTKAGKGEIAQAIYDYNRQHGMRGVKG